MAPSRTIEEFEGLERDPLRRDFPFSLFPNAVIATGIVIGAALTVLIMASNYVLLLVAPHLMADQETVLPFLQWDEIVLILLIAYIATMNEILRVRFIDDYFELRTALKISIDERRRILTPLFARRGRNRALTSLIVVVLALPVLADLFAAMPPHPIAYGSLLIRITLLMWVIGAALCDSFDSNRRIMKAIRGGVEVDLFNLEPLRAMSRTGVRASVAIAIGCALAAPLLAEKTAIVATVILLSINLSVAFVVLYFPTRASRTAIAQTKQNTMDKLDCMIAEAWQRACEGNTDEARAARAELGGLTGMRARVEQISEWPFGAPTIARLIVFALLPLGSWVAAALVENFVQGFVE